MWTGVGGYGEFLGIGSKHLQVSTDDERMGRLNTEGPVAERSPIYRAHGCRVGERQGDPASGSIWVSELDRTLG